ncbi:MAG: Chromosome partitioning ATPase-like protein [Clostridia bacterium 41_269]|nr:MAG: Chromosome partitioning ATPase-like protein [Clostridia bacterium 41_269]
MKCLLAVEEGVVEFLKHQLEKSGLYGGWEFVCCSAWEEVEERRNVPVDVVVLSRFLPGAKPEEALKKTAAFFAGSHIVLLAGEENERQKQYIKIANDMGLYNIVTGRLPGERPYTIFTALKNQKMIDPDGRIIIEPIFEEIEEEARDEHRIPAAVSLEASSLKDEHNKNEEEERSKKVKRAVSEILGNDQGEISTEEIKDRLQEIITMLDREGSRKAVEVEGRRRSRGVLVCTAANKGGAGKTTVAITLAVALSRAGIPTLLADFDLGGPDIASFFGIKDVPGMEHLVGKPVRPNFIRDIIIQKGDLHILPGPMNRTIPNFSRSQFAELIETLKQMYPVVVGDTPAEFWTKPWLFDLFSRADRVLAVVDQSVFSEEDTRRYAPYLLSMGVTPERISIVLNRFSPKLKNVKKIEKSFSAGFKKDVKQLPKTVAVIPEDWDRHALGGYKGEVNLEDGQWHRLAGEIAEMAGYSYEAQAEENGRALGFLGKILKRSTTHRL